MKTIVHQDLSNKIKNIPDYLLEELSDYIDYLLFKKEKDWAEDLSEEEKAIIDRGLEDIKMGRTHSHESVMEEMENYIKSRKNE